MTLDELKVGEKAKILKVGGEGALRFRLLDMGLIPRTEDPLEINLRGYELTLRKADASNIEVEKISEVSR